MTTKQSPEPRWIQETKDINNGLLQNQVIVIHYPGRRKCVLYHYYPSWVLEIQPVVIRYSDQGWQGRYGSHGVSKHHVRASWHFLWYDRINFWFDWKIINVYERRTLVRHLPNLNQISQTVCEKQDSENILANFQRYWLEISTSEQEFRQASIPNFPQKSVEPVGAKDRLK